MFSLTLLTFVTVILSVYSELCILEKSITLNHPRCVENIDCKSNPVRRKRDSHDGDYNITFLKPGSSGFKHYQSIRGDIDFIATNTKLLQKFAVDIDATEDQHCDESNPYRSYDGTCNNLQHPNWGRTDSPMIRLLPARYSGNDGEIRKSILSQSALPSSRLISYLIFEDLDRPSFDHSLAVMQWGQLVAHDIGLTPTPAPIDCCLSSTNVPECYPIQIPPNDPFYSQYNRTCLNMMRSSFEMKQVNCSSTRFQINAVSSVIDLSLVYGSGNITAALLRRFEGGLLEDYRTNDNRSFPRLASFTEQFCGAGNSSSICFFAGDIRVNQNVQLTSLQTVLLREHNRIARELSQINPQWNDEELFQETRNILIAIFQHISYKEWLPLMVGDEYMHKNNLEILPTGYTNYRDDIKSSTIISFMSGAFRFPHSMIQGLLEMYGSYKSVGCPFRRIHFSDYMENPGIMVEDNNYDSLLLGLLIQPSQQNDRFFSTQITNLMFHGSLPYGEDLESLDIQRGRDHGVPTYNDMRQLCGLPRAKTFSNLLTQIDKKLVDLLSRIYESVEDIDYFVGGSLEKLVPGTALGPSFLCIIGEQFARKKFGDRFWFEHGNQTHTFSEEKLAEIRKSSFSRLICDNGDNIHKIQRYGMQTPSVNSNDVIPCSEVPSVNLSKWKIN